MEEIYYNRIISYLYVEKRSKIMYYNIVYYKVFYKLNGVMCVLFLSFHFHGGFIFGDKQTYIFSKSGVLKYLHPC